MRRSASVQIAGRLSYREAIEAYYREHPNATQAEVYRATGAPRDTVSFVYSRLIAAGRLQPTKFARPGDRLPAA